SKDDLALKVLDGHLMTLADSLGPHEWSSIEAAEALFMHIAEHRSIYQGTLTDPEAVAIHMAFEDVIRSHIAPQLADVGALPASIVERYILSTQMAMLRWWLAAEDRPTVHEMAAYTRRLLVNGVGT
ncbi:MAG: TetR-like C-terminal domain-containing protein, partial [Chloroflexota bacterium]